MPYDTRKPFDPSGIRLGTPGITTRGLRPEQMPLIADWMDRAIAAHDNDQALDRIAAEVEELLGSL